jgi:hypothetical protein
VQAHSWDTLARGTFANCILNQIDRWLTFARKRGFRIARMEDIMLVTGCHLVRSWANVAFSESQSEQQLSFKVTVDGSGVNVRWRVSREDAGGVAFNCGPSGQVRCFTISVYAETLFGLMELYQDLPENQCIFVRGFRVTRFLGIIPKVRGAAEPTQDSGGYGPPEFDMQLITIPADTNVRLSTY